jgi:hypothetical protein
LLAFLVSKRALDGARWRGEARAWRDDTRVILEEHGAWIGTTSTSRQRLIWDGPSLLVGEGAAAHVYTLSPCSQRFDCLGDYLCGADFYGFAGPDADHVLAGPFTLRWWVNVALDVPPISSTEEHRRTMKQWALVAHYRLNNKV